MTRVLFYDYDRNVICARCSQHTTSFLFSFNSRPSEKCTSRSLCLERFVDFYGYISELFSQIILAEHENNDYGSLERLC